MAHGFEFTDPPAIAFSSCFGRGISCPFGNLIIVSPLLSTTVFTGAYVVAGFQLAQPSIGCIAHAASQASPKL